MSRAARAARGRGRKDMRGTPLGAVVSAIAISVAGCGKAPETNAVQNAAQATAAEEAPHRIFEAYPAEVAAAIRRRQTALAQASQSSHGMAPSYIIRQTRTWGPGAVVTVAFYGGSPQ